MRGRRRSSRDQNGCTPLMFAVANGNEAVSRRLILALADVNGYDFESQSGLGYAKNNQKLVALLTETTDKLNLDDHED